MNLSGRVGRRLGVFTVLLLGVDLLDELWSGVPYVGAPGIRTDFTLDYATVAGYLLVVPGLAAFLLEPPIFVLADRYPRRRLVCGGLAGLGLAMGVAGAAPNVWVLLAALCVAFPASGIGVNLSQATLMDTHPEQRERYMTRWAFLGVVGDLLTPALFVALTVVGWGWRAACFVCGAALVVYAGVLWFQGFPRDDPPPVPGRPPTAVAIRAAFDNRPLVAWLLGVSLCSLLDEILVAFGALHLRDNLGAGVGARSLVLMCGTGGGLVGLVVSDRVLARVDGRRLLAWSAGACAVAYIGWVRAPDVTMSAGLFFLTGLFAAPLYPIAMAQAYRTLPDQSGMVNALSTLLEPVGILAPLVLGLVADRFGLGSALLLLAAQPVGLLALARWGPWVANTPRAPGTARRPGGAAPPGR